MRKILLFFLILASLTSCLTVKQIERNCDKFGKICLTSVETTEIRDTVWVLKRDTIVEYVLQRDTITNTVYLPEFHFENPFYSDTSRLSVGLAYSEAFIARSRLYHFLESGDTILNIRLNDAITERNHLRQELNKKVQTVTVRKDTQFGKFCKKWFFGSLVIILLGIVVVLLRIRKIF